MTKMQHPFLREGDAVFQYLIKGGQKQSNFLENYCNIPAVKEYIRNILSQSVPIEIPSFAKIKDQKKNGYNQVKYNWRADGYKYEVRCHTRTPGTTITEQIN